MMKKNWINFKNKLCVELDTLFQLIILIIYLSKDLGELILQLILTFTDSLKVKIYNILTIFK
jgi:hypothetical protein